MFGLGVALSALGGRVQGAKVQEGRVLEVLMIVQCWPGPLDGRELLWRVGLLLEAEVALLQLGHPLMAAVVGVSLELYHPRLQGVELGLYHPMSQGVELGLYHPRLQGVELGLYHPMPQGVEVTNFVMAELVAVLPLVVLSAEATEPIKPVDIG